MQDFMEANICADCNYALEYGVEEAQESMRNADIDPESVPVPMNLLHDDPTVRLVTPNYDSETEEGVATFSWSRCDGCGTHDGGYRYRVALWLND